MFKYKSYVQIFTLVFLLFIGYHELAWNIFTSKIFGRKDNLYVGDLGRTSYQVDSLFPRKLLYTLEKKHLSKQNFHNQSIDMITMGDSFSNADTGGLNPYYQDYLATDYNLSILNLRREPMNEYNSFNLTLYLLNSGWLEEHHPKYVLIQSVERFIYSRYAREFDFSFCKDPKYLIEPLKTKNSYLPKLLLINTANYKFFTSKIYYLFKNEYKSVIKFHLKNEMFSTQGFQDTLIITKGDLDGIHNEKEKAILINNNLNKLAKLLNKFDIKLIFMPSIDKYNLYEPYIANNSFQKSLFFENMRPLQKDYYFVDTKAILQKQLLNKKDIFYPDDTHWSYKASAIISKNMKKIFSNAK